MNLEANKRFVTAVFDSWIIRWEEENVWVCNLAWPGLFFTRFSARQLNKITIEDLFLDLLILQYKGNNEFNHLWLCPHPFSIITSIHLDPFPPGTPRSPAPRPLIKNTHPASPFPFPSFHPFPRRMSVLPLLWPRFPTSHSLRSCTFLTR